MKGQRLFFLGLTFLLTACRWDQADAFQKNLWCGMQPEEIKALSERFDAPTFRKLDEPTLFVTHTLRKNNSFVEFFINNDGLETVRIGHHYGLTGTEYEPRWNLCTGEKIGTIELSLVGPREYAGARIFIDDEELLRFPSEDPIIRTFGISSGPHEIEVVRAGYETLVLRVNYDIDRKEARIDIAPSARHQFNE